MKKVIILIIIIFTVLLLAITNPSSDSFNEFISSMEPSNDGLLSSFGSLITKKVIVNDKKYSNFIVFSIVTSGNAKFIGVLGNWFPVK